MALADARDIAERTFRSPSKRAWISEKSSYPKKKLPEPKDYKSVFLALAQAHIIRAEMTSFLSDMAGTRNILVHSYDEVDNGLMYGILKRHLNDFDLFLTEIRDNYLLKA